MLTLTGRRACHATRVNIFNVFSAYVSVLNVSTREMLSMLSLGVGSQNK